jgi:excisionase family DNA binding protein
MTEGGLEHTVTSGEAARLLGVSQTWVGMRVKRGQLRATATPLGRLIDRAGVERLAAKRRDRGPRDPLPAA